ncbi:hypothetical protein EVAR_96299_1 [Eumeta japonica]|uniref:Uncharacterized protein n=1 Tax=Eumeta variegata TaxID=151549 RepID=A0A4C1VW73_EUMVA|nr:hypothetical protein EVAR_96299_1 [Eumeta japonica]
MRKTVNRWRVGRAEFGASLAVITDRPLLVLSPKGRPMSRLRCPDTSHRYLPPFIYDTPISDSENLDLLLKLEGRTRRVKFKGKNIDAG